jgi:hypothetical protein
MKDELRQDDQRLKDGSPDWRQWWERHGERELRCILMSAWDPVGAGDTPEAWDEYDGYLSGVAHRLRDATNTDAAEQTIAAYLSYIERDYMGMAADTSRHNQELAATLVAWHEWSFMRGGRPPREWRIDDD